MQTIEDMSTAFSAVVTGHASPPSPFHSFCPILLGIFEIIFKMVDIFEV